MDPTNPRPDPECTNSEALAAALDIRIAAELHAWTLQRLNQLCVPDKLASYPIQTLLEEIAQEKERIKLKYARLREYLGLKEDSKNAT